MKSKIDLLKTITRENGATEAEEQTAREMINAIINGNKHKGCQDIVTTQHDDIRKYGTYKDYSKSTVPTSKGIEVYLQKNEISKEIKTQTETQLQTEIKTKTETKGYFVCPVCGNDMFYSGTCGGSSQNLLCDKCFTEFNDAGGLGIQYTHKVDLDRAYHPFGISMRRLRRENPEGFKILYNNSPWWQKLIANLRLYK